MRCKISSNFPFALYFVCENKTFLTDLDSFRPNPKNYLKIDEEYNCEIKFSLKRGNNKTIKRVIINGKEYIHL